jgi:hypothetical protein
MSARTKTTVYLDADLLRAVKAVAATTGQHDYEIFERALRDYLSGPVSMGARATLQDLLDRMGGRPAPADDDALAEAYEELHARRRDRA